MRLYINDRLRIKDLQEHFHKCFPSLGLAFFSNYHKVLHLTGHNHLIDGNALVGDIRKRHENGFLEIMSWHTCAKVEEELKEMFALNAKISCCNTDDTCMRVLSGEEFTLQQLSELCSHYNTAAPNEQSLANLGHVTT